MPSTTEQDVNGVIVDLNRVTRRYLREWFKNLDGAENGEALTGELVEKIVVSWPFGDVSKEAYLQLGAYDGELVDEALETALAVYMKKKSERRSILAGDIAAD